VESLYEIISPDTFLRPYIADYGFLAEIYNIVRNAFAKRVNVDREFLRKTNQLVRDHVDIYKLESGLEVFPIDEATLDKIKQRHQNDNVKVINLIKSIEKYVEENSGDLSLMPLAVKAQEIQQLYEDRQQETQKVLDELAALIESEIKRREEARAKGFDGLAAFIWVILSDKQIASPDDNARKMRVMFDQYPTWRVSEQASRDLRTALYGVLIQIDQDMDKVVSVVDYLFTLIEKAKAF
jgi:type I restriction enzyme R subunit